MEQNSNLYHEEEKNLNNAENPKLGISDVSCSSISREDINKQAYLVHFILI